MEELLRQIEAQCRLARAALADEREGDFKGAVEFIFNDADKLDHLVGGM